MEFGIVVYGGRAIKPFSIKYFVKSLLSACHHTISSIRSMIIASLFELLMDHVCIPIHIFFSIRNKRISNRLLYIVGDSQLSALLVYPFGTTSPLSTIISVTSS